MNELIKPSTKIHTIDDAIRLSKKRLPKLVFDFIDGASGDDKLAEINSTACLLYTSPSPRDLSTSRMPSSA